MGSDGRLRSYSPERRTALVLCGTGAHGTYHAGVLRAIQEAGVKIDLVAGHGIGAGGAALAAIDGGARLWEPDGIWRSPAAHTFYAWKPLLRTAGWITALLTLVLVIPIVVLAVGLLAYATGFLIAILGLAAGVSLMARVSAWLQAAFVAEMLPTIVARMAMIVLAALALVAAVGLAVQRWRAPARRRSAGRWWWQVAGAPLDASVVRDRFLDAIWQLIRGAAVPARPSSAVISRRYAEVLTENVGQPGFRELLTIGTNLDGRCDVIVALLREPFRRDFVAPRPGRDRRAEVLDLTGPGRNHALDVVASAMTPPIACDPALVTFPVDSFWRGETHRLCDRPAASNRLLEEVAAAGATQVIVVSAVAAARPHQLGAPRLAPRHRLGDFLVAAECAALRDALAMASFRFDSVFMICPTHNPIGPFDVRGVHDDASDRHLPMAELMDRGYEDAYRQFIEPIVGASGDHLSRPEADGLRLNF